MKYLLIVAIFLYVGCDNTNSNNSNNAPDILDDLNVEIIRDIQGTALDEVAFKEFVSFENVNSNIKNKTLFKNLLFRIDETKKHLELFANYIDEIDKNAIEGKDLLDQYIYDNYSYSFNVIYSEKYFTLEYYIEEDLISTLILTRNFRSGNLNLVLSNYDKFYSLDKDYSFWGDYKSNFFIEESGEFNYSYYYKFYTKKLNNDRINEVLFKGFFNQKVDLSGNGLNFLNFDFEKVTHSSSSPEYFEWKKDGEIINGSEFK